MLRANEDAACRLCPGTARPIFVANQVYAMSDTQKLDYLQLKHKFLIRLTYQLKQNKCTSHKGTQLHLIDYHHTKAALR